MYGDYVPKKKTPATPATAPVATPATAPVATPAPAPVATPTTTPVAPAASKSVEDLKKLLDEKEGKPIAPTNDSNAITISLSEFLAQKSAAEIYATLKSAGKANEMFNYLFDSINEDARKKFIANKAFELVERDANVCTKAVTLILQNKIICDAILNGMFDSDKIRAEIIDALISNFSAELFDAIRKT